MPSTRISRPSLPFLSTLLIMLALCWPTLNYAAPPQTFTAEYKAKFRGIPISATRQLETLEDGSQLFTFTADSFLAKLKETSKFHWNDNGHIVPLSYTYKRGGLGRDRKAHLVFDWANKKVTNDVQDKVWKMDIPIRALDKLSYQLQLRADLLNGKSLDGYDIADGGKLKQYDFEVLGEEELRTPAGRFQVIKVKRLREQDDERQTIIWFAKNWDYLVVRLQQEEDDKSYEIDLVSATLNGERVRGGE